MKHIKSHPQLRESSQEAPITTAPHKWIRGNPDTHVLIKFQADYADEFDVYGFSSMSTPDFGELVADSMENFQKMVDAAAARGQKRGGRRSGGITVGFGTNEELHFANFEVYIRAFKPRYITATEHAFLKTAFGGNRSRSEFGFCPFPLEY